MSLPQVIKLAKVVSVLFLQVHFKIIVIVIAKHLNFMLYIKKGIQFYRPTLQIYSF